MTLSRRQLLSIAGAAGLGWLGSKLPLADGALAAPGPGQGPGEIGSIPRGDQRIALISDLNSSYGSTSYVPQVHRGVQLLQLLLVLAQLPHFLIQLLQIQQPLHLLLALRQLLEVGTRLVDLLLELLPLRLLLLLLLERCVQLLLRQQQLLLLLALLLQQLLLFVLPLQQRL